MLKDDFRNFLIIQKMEEDKKKVTLLGAILSNKWKILSVIILLLFGIFVYKFFFTKINLEKLKVKNDLFQINSGESISHIGKRLEGDGIINSYFAFKMYMRIFAGKNIAQAGIYQFDQKDNLVSVANKIIGAHYAIPPVKVTIPEGSDNQDIAKILSVAFLNDANKSQLVDDFSSSNIYSYIKNKEGYLFPETYLFLPNTSLDQVVKQMSDKFYFNLKDIFSSQEERQKLGIYSLDLKDFKIENYFNDTDKTINLTKRFSIISQIGTTTVTMKDIITMASYLEGEANNEKDMRNVSGVLWTRLRLNYPLQIDAATSTYKNKGFTLTPINNPGMMAILAAISPINTGNIYYITGNDGVTYYARDYKSHLDNINRYLRNR